MARARGRRPRLIPADPPCRGCGHRASLHTRERVVVDGVDHGTCAACSEAGHRPACGRVRAAEGTA